LEKNRDALRKALTLDTQAGDKGYGGSSEFGEVVFRRARDGKDGWSRMSCGFGWELGRRELDVRDIEAQGEKRGNEEGEGVDVEGEGPVAAKQPVVKLEREGHEYCLEMIALELGPSLNFYPALIRL
jgi:hypothetical protein